MAGAWFGWFLAAGMMITGSLNTITTKAADNVNTIDRYGNTVQFNHPFVQAICMFIGEASNLIPFLILRYRAKAAGTHKEGKPFNLLWLWLPALCDLTGTSVMYLGLSLTDASIFQMLRGSVVVFTAIFSVVFLKRKQYGFHWLGVVLVLIGAAIVGTQTYVCGAGSSTSTSNSRAMIGNGLIIMAQIIVAVQMVIEEKLIGDADLHPMQVVGMEGTFGFFTLAVVLGIMYAVPAPAFICNGAAHCDHFEDTWDALVNMQHSGLLVLYLLGNMVSIAFFNAFGVAITKYSSASSRMVIDSLRTMVIWAFSLAVKWESFCWIQIIGFVFLLAGSMIYNQVLRVPGMFYPEAAPSKDALLDEEEDDGNNYEYYEANGAGQGFVATAGGRGGYGRVEADI